MWRILLFFIAVTGAALGFSWLADRPGSVDIVWQGKNYHMELMTLVLGFLASLFILMLTWWLIKNLVIAPGRLSRHMKIKNREKGLDAVSRGLIAVSAGDAALAKKLASRASRKLDAGGLATLLKAQAAQLSGDRRTARQLYEAMLENPETEIAGLRGLYLEARREKEMEAARQFADRAVRRNPRLSWSTQALLEIQSRSGQWDMALKTLELARKNNKTDKHTYTRQRAVLLAALALENEQGDMDTALAQALEAHKLAPDLVPAADVAGRILAAQGNVRRASKIIMETWEISPHPDLARTYAHARPGDSPRDRLARVRQLSLHSPHNMEGPIALAEAAIESHDWDEARNALKELVDKRPTERVCTLMARIEGGEFGDKGRVREWLARAVRAPRDPAWIADGYVSEHWAPISPITGRLDAFEWKVPLEQLEHRDEELPFEGFIPQEAKEGATAAMEEKPVVLATAGSALTKAAADEASQASGTKDAKKPATSSDKATPGDSSAAESIADDAEIIEAEPVEEPVAFTPSKGAGEKAVAKTGSSKPEEETEIFVQPRMPDDPGPFSSTGSKNPRLPQRFRQSQ